VTSSWVVSAQWLSSGGAYCRVPTPHAQIVCELGLSLLVQGCGLRTTFLYLFTTVWDAEARGPHALTMSPPIVLPPPRLSLFVGIRREHVPGLQKHLKRLYHADPRDAREAGQRPRLWTLTKTPSCPVVLSNGFLSWGPTMLTLVNARGPYDTIT